ncbi:MAG: polyphosphate polymerase domain-containing protein [Chitinophagaceae bacterium]|nr:MAG: polyphosphate polymerase domain-containing protein [Chitinophagaceae bacterium]
MKLRYERKYLVHNDLQEVLRERFKPFLRPDKHAIGPLEYPEYTVRSIYFDTHDMAAYLDKIEGYKRKKKLRIRGYNVHRNGDKVVFEIKRKIGDRIYKNRVFLEYEELPKVMDPSLDSGGESLRNKSFLNDPSYKKFKYNLLRYHMHPVILISYEREPYHGQIDSGVRVTFDKNIRSKFAPSLDELYSETFMRPLFKDHFILEIKYFTDFMPSWAKSIVAEYNLRREALSKFSIGIDAHHDERMKLPSSAFRSYRLSGLSNFVFKKKL